VILAFSQSDFSFVYLPDIHLNPDSLVKGNFESIAKRVNSLKPDFILTGGDMIYTAKNVDDTKATSLFDFMDEELKIFQMPVYFTMGNHETVGITIESGIDKSNPNWGKQMYKKRYTTPYYTFFYEGWKFFVLDGIKILEKEKNYTQGVDSLQIEWIKDELLKTDKNVPIIISIHTPLVNPHAITDSKSQALSANSEVVMNCFKDHNLKMVLQGHNHIYMNLLLNDIHYVSGGSTSYGTDAVNSGFLLVKITDDAEESHFIHIDTTNK
jgi:Icc protein